ncbi:histone-like nucleoid-structuring protein Lsr2 [Promicromonospora vindobonensis]|uniref:Histone-like nucleoid-structuring protein Lsr2 n=1 Tax=Promicromonospora vindobonensis TaxID=195748 RepID=A0ABW5VVP9_9MICO
MTVRNVVVVESDISGKPDAGTVVFGLADTWYEIDLTDEEQKDLERVLKTYREAGRRASKKTGDRVPSDTTPEEREQIRIWARAQGYDFADRGRIPKRIYSAYREAHKESDRSRARTRNRATKSS